MATRNLLLVRVLKDDDADPGETGPVALNMASLGRLSEIRRSLEPFNTGPDGSPEGASVFYGPGVTLQLPMVGPDDPVMQIMVTLTDETIAWPVLERVCSAMGWKMMDPKTGRTFGGW